jgi:hypothetical protein
MITLLASIAGFITSIIPELLKFFRDKQDKTHELSIMDKQIQHSKKAANKAIEEIQISRDIAEHKILYSTYSTGISWVDALNGSVRPMLAYSFFFLYTFVKYIQYCAICESVNAIEYMDLIWSIDDQAIFASIISFYFGQRTFSRMMRRG